MSADLPRRAAFLDRDGVICVDRGYLHRSEDFAFVPGAVEGLRRLAAYGYALTVVTNQSGIARGYFSEDDYAALTRHMVTRLEQAGIRLAGIRHCPHLPHAEVAAYRQACACRKPAPGMILQLAQALNLDLAASVLVGDKGSDIQAGRAAGVGRCLRVRSGHALSSAELASADAVYDDLLACALALCRPAGAGTASAPADQASAAPPCVR